MGLLIIAAFFLLMVLGYPVVLAIAIPAILYIIFNDLPIDMIAQRLHYALDSYPLIAVPIFIFAGNLMNTTGITRRIYKFADILVGRVHGGLAQVNIFAGLIFAGMSGAALAAVGGLGPITIKTMKEKGFSSSFSAAVTISSATVGPIFPPSIPLIIYGSVASVSIVKLLLAGIVPAIIIVVMLMITTALISLFRKYPRAERWSKASEIFKSFLPAIPALLAPALLVFGMLSGFFTPTEAAGAMVVYIIFLSGVVYRELNIKHILQSAAETIRLSSGILIIVSTASLFGWILAVEQIPQMFADFLLSFSKNPYILLSIVNIMLLIIGMVLDSTTATLLVVPIIAPPLVAAGVDPVHLGIVTIFNLMVGLITPPLGLSLFLVSDIAKVPMNKILKEVVWYLIPLIIALMIVTYIPKLSLWIPNLIK